VAAVWQDIAKGKIQSSKHLARAKRKWCSRGGEGFKSSGGTGMSLLTWVLAGMLFIALLYIAVDRLMVWLTKQGGFTIRIEPEDEDE